ncbi:MAG: NAD(P)-binding protein, partial [Oscillospiraceae bacterium]|nr:NAD(P)-binding protein [Oscillospiraceae bacterium]
CLIVGAGLYGAVFAREAADRGKRVLVIDRRKNAGGNVYTETVEGIHVHVYGSSMEERPFTATARPGSSISLLPPSVPFPAFLSFFFGTGAGSCSSSSVRRGFSLSRFSRKIS